MNAIRTILITAVFFLPVRAMAADPWIVLEGGDGPGKGKHIVLVSGDEEYRSEESLPQLAIDKMDETINPNETHNIPGLEALKTADLMVVFLRFRDLPDEQMKYIVDYVESGKPIIGMRTATHSFNTKSKEFGKYTWTSKEWDGGFGRQVLGETWVNHHGSHGKEGTRGIIAKGQEDHPILRGIKDGDIFGTTDVYTVNLPLKNSDVLVLGEVTETLKPDSKAVEGKKNDPMMPVAWTRVYEPESGKKARIFTTTMGASQDLQFEGTRRMLVNAAYWTLNLEDKIPSKSNVEIVGEFNPLPFRFGGHKKGVKPEDLLK
jgi:type 1 glutamine amidotransferase